MYFTIFSNSRMYVYLGEFNCFKNISFSPGVTRSHLMIRGNSGMNGYSLKIDPSSLPNRVSLTTLNAAIIKIHYPCKWLLNL